MFYIILKYISMVVKKSKPQKSTQKKKSTMKPWNFDKKKFLQEMNELNWLYRWVEKYMNTPEKDRKLKTKYF